MFWFMGKTYEAESHDEIINLAKECVNNMMKRSKQGDKMEIMTRETTKGRQYMFRWNGQLFVFNTKQEAEVKLMEFKNGSLFA